MNKFDLLEKEGRTEFQKLSDRLGFTNVKFTPETYTYDVTWEFNDKRYIGEIKKRRNYSYTYPTILAERIKLKRLWHNMNELMFDGAFYINFYYDNTSHFFWLNKMVGVDIEKTQIVASKYTAIKSEKISKDCLMLSPKENYCIIKKWG